MSKRMMVSIIQAYAPTADSSVELHEEFYEELQDLIRSQKSSCIILGGDFNARIGPRSPGERFIGPNSAEIRNNAGEILANFCKTRHLYHGNSHFFKSPRRRKLAEDHKNFSLPRLLDAATNRRSPKGSKQGLAECRNAIPCLRTADGTRTASRTGIELTMANFYTTLFRTRLGLLNMKNELKPEILRMKRAGWAAFNSVRGVIESVKDHALRANIFNSTVLPALCYSCETWTLTKAAEDQLRRIQVALKRKMVGISLHQQRMSGMQNDQIRAMSRGRDIVIHADEAKHHFAGHLMRRTDGRWSTSTVRWEPLDKKRPAGRPPLRWHDSLAHHNNIRTPNPRPIKVLTHWATLTQDRTKWKRRWDLR
ncbi:unnamed protein product [Nippostrongylus brasiliensis]|uniref:Endo/exonuclease/phosphatase domain-containing protein n=1 Tax=Nippostrongylus brasiliensis TaxID=27835 RepID=A0A0N4YUH8_NIPBR|nr:unnamed protein product [Nippostrongylus brasiliensis]